MTLLLGAIADDITGASDLANTLTKAGMRTTLYMGIPESAADCDAAVIAQKTRSIPAGQAVAASLAALDWLQGQGVAQVLFKYCSTFDSTPEGNIGPVADALLGRLGGHALVCPAFPGAGRTVYAGHLFVGGVPLHESGMRHHPLNPMTDPDLRRWLGLQSQSRIAHLPWEVVSQGRAAIAAALAGIAAPALVVADAITDADLTELGAACANAALITGGSGIALGLPANFRARGQLAAPVLPKGVAGPGVVLSGSCSTASLAQVAEHAAHHPARLLSVQGLLSGAETPEALADWAWSHVGDLPMIYTTAAPAEVAAAQAMHGRETVSALLEGAMGALASALVARGFTRLAIGGGETSGAVMGALGLTRLEIGAEIAPGVPEVYAQGLGLALKSGNFGGTGFYAAALTALEA